MSTIEIMRRAHYLARMGENQLRSELEKLVKAYPGLQEEMRRNLETYGTPILARSMGGCWAEDLPQEVHSIGSGFGYRPVEMVLKPQGPDAYNWQIEWYILT